MVWWTDGASQSAGYARRQLDRVPRFSVLLNISLEQSIDAARLASRMQIVALGGAVTNRRFQNIGALDALPINYSMLPGLVASGRLAIDVVLLQLAADGHAFNFSLMVDHLADAVPRARTVVEINDLLSVACGDARIEATDVDHLISVSRKPFEVAPRPTLAIEKEIASHVSRLIGDGATLQVGLGFLPDAVLESLTGKKALGVHSGTIGDRVADLVDAGVITNLRKPIDTGKCIAGTLLGSRRLYRWAHRNTSLEMRSPRYTHDILVHATIPHLIGINTALEVDLTGQINAEVAENRHVGMSEDTAISCAAASNHPAGAASLPWRRPRAMARYRELFQGYPEGSSPPHEAMPTSLSPSTVLPSCGPVPFLNAHVSSSQSRIQTFGTHYPGPPMQALYEDRSWRKPTQKSSRTNFVVSIWCRALAWLTFDNHRGLHRIGVRWSPFHGEVARSGLAYIE